MLKKQIIKRLWLLVNTVKAPNFGNGLNFGRGFQLTFVTKFYVTFGANFGQIMIVIEKWKILMYL